MIEQLTNVPENLLGDFEVIEKINDLQQENQEAEKKIDNFQGLQIHTSDSFAKEMEKEFGKKEDTKEDKKSESEKEDEDKESDKVDETKEGKENKEENKDKKEEKKPENKEEDDEDNSISYSFKGLASYLSEEGVIDFEDSEDIEDTPEILVEAVKKEINEAITSYKESVPEIGKRFLEYLEKGGDETKFYQSLERSIDLDNIDLEDEENQELIVREYLKQLEWDLKEIDETIEQYKDGLLLDKQAKLASKKLEKIYEKSNENLIREQEKLIQENNKKITEYLDSVKNTIKTAKTLAGLDVPEKEKQDFTDYLIKVNPKTGMTKYQEDLNENQIQNQIELAYLKYKKYDFSKAQKKAETKVTQELKNKIFQKSETSVKGKTREDAEKVDFSAFGMFKNNKK